MATKNEVMENNDEVPENQKTPKEPSKKNKTTLIVILMGVLIMTITPLATWFAVRTVSTETGAESSDPTQPQKPASAAILFALDPLVVNISETRMTRVLRVQAHLVLSEARLEDVLKEMMPIVKDRIMSTTGRRTLAELENDNDRAALKRDIVLTINELVRDRMSGSILDVAFSEFLIQ